MDRCREPDSTDKHVHTDVCICIHETVEECLSQSILDIEISPLTEISCSNRTGCKSNFHNNIVVEDTLKEVKEKK